jgi:hypothetical protein
MTNSMPTIAHNVRCHCAAGSAYKRAISVITLVTPLCNLFGPHAPFADIRLMAAYGAKASPA